MLSIRLIINLLSSGVESRRTGSLSTRNLRAAAAVVLVWAGILSASPAMSQELTKLTDPLFITDITADAGGKLITSNRGDGSVRMYDPATPDKPLWVTPLAQRATGVLVDGGKIYATGFTDKGVLYVLNSATGAIEQEIAVGSGATAPAASADGTKVYVMDQFADKVEEVDVATGKVTRSVNVLREPKGAVASKDGKYLFVANFLPSGRADLDFVGADVSVIDLANFTKIKDIKLANGSNALRGIGMSPDGQYVFVSHNMGRFTVPTSQLQQGWMNTSAMSLIDTKTLEFGGSLVLDDPEFGAAGIWDIKAVGDKIFVTHSGTHDLSVIDYPAMVAKLKSYAGTIDNLSYDLRFMYGMRERLLLHGNGPRKMAVIGDKLYIPTFFSDTLNVYDIPTGTLTAQAMVNGRTENSAQVGERVFNDATYCFQNWQSCNGCHPGDARTDGMNWDLMNDGIGNSKNCKSLLFSHISPPSMISGIRVSAELAVRKGFTHIQFHDIPEGLAVSVDEYLKSLKPVPSPYLVNGELSEQANAGRKVFEREQCDQCHSGSLYTDMKMHRIGENIEFETGWDTPTLREVWRTAPYLFNGRAATMRDVFSVYKHGIKGKISDKEINQLVEYVNSL